SATGVRKSEFITGYFFFDVSFLVVVFFLDVRLPSFEPFFFLGVLFFDFPFLAMMSFTSSKVRALASTSLGNSILVFPLMILWRFQRAFSTRIPSSSQLCTIFSRSFFFLCS